MQELGRPAFFLACRHHVTELIVKAHCYFRFKVDLRPNYKIVVKLQMNGSRKALMVTLVTCHKARFMIFSIYSFKKLHLEEETQQPFVFLTFLLKENLLRMLNLSMELLKGVLGWQWTIQYTYAKRWRVFECLWTLVLSFAYICLTFGVGLHSFEFLATAWYQEGNSHCCVHHTPY